MKSAVAQLAGGKYHSADWILYQWLYPVEPRSPRVRAVHFVRPDAEALRWCLVALVPGASRVPSGGVQSLALAPTRASRQG